ncbi:MAG TPA: protease pro-enzyme activation domain-containing protein [Rhizomicrobium sp.]|jgi:subtilase family serine protease
MQKLKIALLGATLVGCGFATATHAAPHNVGMTTVLGTAPTAQQVRFDVFLPLRHKDQLEKLLEAQQNSNSPQYHKWLTPAQFGEQFGPDRTTIARVANALRTRGFAVKAQTRSVHVTGTVDLVNRHFGIHLVTARSTPGTSLIVTNEPLQMPKELAAVGAQIPSFAPLAAHTFSQVAGKVYDKPTGRRGAADNRYSDTGPYWFTDMRQAYGYPSYNATVTANGTTKPLNGKGAIIGVLISGDVLDSDIQDMFDHEHWTDITGQPAPKLAARIALNGGAPFNPNELEPSLDVQQELTSAPGAAVVLYNIPSLSQADVVGGYLEIVEDNLLDVVSSSFGLCEKYFYPAYNGGQDFRYIPQIEHELFMQGNSQGMSFLASSGDRAGKECASVAYFNGHPSHFIPGVSSPAADPNVTAVGGTNLVTSYDGGATLTSKYVTENAWEDPEVPQDPYGVGVPLRGGVWGAGGGYSVMFPAPSYQMNVATGSNMRALPDIGMQVGGCPGGISKLDKKGHCNGGNDPQNGSGNTQRSAAIVAVDHVDRGSYLGVIGSSISSPEFAGVAAHLVEQHGRMGNVNNYIYRLAARQTTDGHRYYHTNIPGYNGIEDTDLNSSYSLSNGVGTPIVKNFIGQHQVERAGNPQTPSNP